MQSGVGGCGYSVKFDQYSSVAVHVRGPPLVVGGGGVLIRVTIDVTSLTE